MGNVPSTAKDKALKKFFKDLVGPVESVRFRSIAVVGTKVGESSYKLMRKAAAITGNIDEKRETKNAYVVFRDLKSVDKAVAENGKRERTTALYTNALERANQRVREPQCADAAAAVAASPTRTLTTRAGQGLCPQTSWRARATCQVLPRAPLNCCLRLECWILPRGCLQCLPPGVTSIAWVPGPASSVWSPGLPPGLE